MSGTKLNVRWAEFVTWPPVPIPTPDHGLFVRLGVEPSEKHCPSCNSIIYSRRHKVCGVCGEDLPQRCRFSPDEARRVDQLLRSERERHRIWLRKVAAT